jgi:hypothetical protein
LDDPAATLTMSLPVAAYGMPESEHKGGDQRDDVCGTWIDDAGEHRSASALSDQGLSVYALDRGFLDGVDPLSIDKEPGVYRRRALVTGSVELIGERS